MDSANWLSALSQAARLFVQSIPEAFWLAYYWAKEWQTLLGGLLLVVAARIFAQGTIRAARIRSAATVRAAQITADATDSHADRTRVPAPPASALSPPAPALTRPSPAPPASLPAQELLAKIEQLRSLIRSAMFMLASEEQSAASGPNLYCERIAQLRFAESDLPANPTAGTLELYKKLLLQMTAVRRATERKLSHAELSQALVQLNGRARELAAAITIAMAPLNTGATRATKQASG
jgi:hypothetical protein